MFHRKNKARKLIEKYKNIGVNRLSRYCDPLILTWAHAATRQFPFLLENCSCPLYLERAYKFTDITYYALNFQAKHKTICQIHTYLTGRYAIDRQNLFLIEFILIRFCASGNVWYIEHIKEIIEAMDNESRESASELFNVGLTFVANEQSNDEQLTYIKSFSIH